MGMGCHGGKRIGTCRGPNDERPCPSTPASVAITVKVPEDVASQLRAHAQATGATIGDVVARAVLGLLARKRRRA